MSWYENEGICGITDSFLGKFINKLGKHEIN